MNHQKPTWVAYLLPLLSQFNIRYKYKLKCIHYNYNSLYMYFKSNGAGALVAFRWCCDVQGSKKTWILKQLQDSAQDKILTKIDNRATCIWEYTTGHNKDRASQSLHWKYCCNWTSSINESNIPEKVVTEKLYWWRNWDVSCTKSSSVFPITPHYGNPALEQQISGQILQIVPKPQTANEQPVWGHCCHVFLAWLRW